MVMSCDLPTFDKIIYESTRIAIAAGLMRLRIDKDHAKIVDVRLGGAGHHQVPDPTKETCRVIVLQKSDGVDAKVTSSLHGIGQYQRAGGIVGFADAAIGAVGIAGNAIDAVSAVERNGEAEGILLVGTARTVAANGYGQFAP